MIPIPPLALEKYLNEFVALTKAGTSEYAVTPCSPWPSELFALVALGRWLGIDRWVESGTYLGQSTSILAQAMPQIPVISVEKDPVIARQARARLERFRGQVYVCLGDGAAEVPRLVSVNQTPVGVFIDGPKGLPAVVLIQKLWEDYPQVRLIGLHDTYGSVPGRPVAARAALDCFGLWSKEGRGWATDDPEYVAAFRYLDEGMHDRHRPSSGVTGWLPYTWFHDGKPWSMVSYGPTITFLLRR